jgi:hypothetical protein
MTAIERTRAYLSKMPLAISGQGGHDSAFNAAIAAAIGFNLSDSDALAALASWNAACQPPWSERELRQKITSARRDCRRPPGYLLDEAPSRPGVSPRYEDESERKACQRQDWPQFKPLKPSGLEAVARLRKLPLPAVILAARAGFLSGAMVDGQPCFILHEGSFAQARRLDGQPFVLADGRQVKAKNLPGAQGAFIGARWLGSPSVNVLLVEGCIALLEALAAHELTDPAKGWSILAATSASARFNRAPDLLAALAGRFVRIVPDLDEAGLNAAASWLADLEKAGCQVDAHPLPSGIKDLGPVVASPAAHTETLNALFQ